MDQPEPSIIYTIRVLKSKTGGLFLGSSQGSGNKELLWSLRVEPPGTSPLRCGPLNSVQRSRQETRLNWRSVLSPPKDHVNARIVILYIVHGIW